MVNYIRYANQGATRNQELSEDLLKRLGYLEKLGVTAEVFSGGQPAKGEGPRVGSERHDHGGAGDFRFYQGDRKLDWANEADRPIFEQIVSQGKENGITGFGAGPGYMSQGTMHIGMGNPGVWGAGGSSKNAPDWLKAAYNGAPTPAYEGKPDVIAEVIAAGNPNPGTLPSPQLQSVAMATNTTTEPKSNNGILMDAFNKITGKNVQMPQPPKEILGVETGKFTNAASGIGDFAKALTESNDSLNKQIQASARSGGRSNTPVEFTMMPSRLPLKKKKGSLGGLGGYFA
jgi:hypothetical protein